MSISISDELADTFTQPQLDMLATASEATHATHWLETSERKSWLLTAHARRISEDRILVWSETDEAGTEDIELVTGNDAEAAAARHAHSLAGSLDGRGVIAYAMSIVARWERKTGTARPVTEDTVDERLAEWTQRSSDAGDRETRLASIALASLVGEG